MCVAPDGRANRKGSELALKNVNLIAILLTLDFLTSQFSTSFVIWNVGLSDFVF